MNFLLAWLILALGVFAAAKLLPGVHVPNFWDAVVVAAVFGVLNFFLGWLVFVVLGIATLGIGFLLFFITRLFVNAILLKLTDSLTNRIAINGFGNALLAALVISGVGILADMLL
ncbi:MAG: phage holin family protein [Bythopirellula sp.]|nr:phage holin family protein [Bythopirellula sp.]